MQKQEVLQSLSTHRSKKNETSAPQDNLKIISWNIFMLPRFVMRTGQLERAKEIVNVLKNYDADMIVFQEAFDDVAREIIRDGLNTVFPYESGDPPKNVFWKTSSGIWIISKIPFITVKHMYFKNAKGPDWFACKGALLIQAEKNNFPFQVLGTHLQSDFGGKQSQKIRKLQCEQIYNELLEPYAAENVPQFLVGDFNTIHHEPQDYQEMLNTLNVKQCTLEGELNYSYDYLNNDLIRDTGNPQLIDYILYTNHEQHRFDARMIINVFRKQWHTKFCDLSDHFAVSGIFQFR